MTTETKPTKTKRTTGQYLVLRRCDDGRWEQIETQTSRDSASAIRSAAIDGDTIYEGEYVAVPLSSFNPKFVRQVVHVTLADR